MKCFVTYSKHSPNVSFCYRYTSATPLVDGKLLLARDLTDSKSPSGS